MLLNELKVINIPDIEWVARLKRDNFVWLPKEKIFAKIEFPWNQSMGLGSGSIALRKYWTNDNGEWGFKNLESWHVRPNGAGFDGKYIMLPVEGHCPDKNPEMSAILVERLDRTVSLLVNKVCILEKFMYENYPRV